MTKLEIRDEFIDKFKVYKKNNPERTTGEMEITKVINTLIIHTGGTFGMIKKDSYYEAQPNQLQANIRSNPILNHSRTDELYYQKDNVRLNYTIWEDAVQDSSNATINDFVEYVRTIEKYYNDYDSFIVIHGTDTMSYATASVSFMIENLSKPIIFTGSMLPLIEKNSDAPKNLEDSFLQLMKGVQPAVYLQFFGRLALGTRIVKTNATDADAFTKLDYELFKTSGETKFYYKIESDIYVLKLTPFMVGNLKRDVIEYNNKLQDALVDASCNFLLYQRTLVEEMLYRRNAIIIESFGNGNIPEWLLDVFKKINKKVIIVNVSRCVHGRIEGSYKSGWIMKNETNVISCGDITSEAALAKLSFLLANYDHSDVRHMFSINMRGEVLMGNADFSYMH